MRLGLETRLRTEIRRLRRRLAHCCRQVGTAAWARVMTMTQRETDSRSILELELVRLRDRWDIGNDRKGGVKDSSLISEGPFTEPRKKDYIAGSGGN